MPNPETKEPDEQVDLFLETIVDTPLRDDRALMEFPFFSLTKRPQMKPLVFERDDVKITVSPGPRGTASVWDRDVLVYAASKVNERLERGEKVSRTVSFVAHDFLKMTHRGTNRGSYELLKDALFRLRSTTVETTITSGGQRNHRGFGWIDTFEIVEDERPDGSRRMRAVEITLSDWMYRALTKERRVLSISPEYFKLDGGLERRLYQLARKHVGRQRQWKIGLALLAQKVGSAQELRFFKRDLKRIIEQDNIPDYRFSVNGESNIEVSQEAINAGFILKTVPNDRLIVIVTPKAKRSSA
ncbi:MAG: replication initiator protein A [Caulobacteraceae bacterium]